MLPADLIVLGGLYSFKREVSKISYPGTSVHLFIIVDPLSSVIKIECTWCVSKKRKSEIVKIKKFKSKVTKYDRVSVSKKSLKSG